MSLIESQIAEVRLKVALPNSVDILSVINQPTISIVATNTGPRGPQGEAGHWVALTPSEYDALDPPDPDVLYVIIQ